MQLTTKHVTPLPVVEQLPYQRLAAEERAIYGSEFRRHAEEGGINYKWLDSLIDLHPNTYAAHWPGLSDAQRPVGGIPGEQLSYGHNGTDAYATALLATDTYIAEGCTMTVSCRYSRNEDDSLNLVYSSQTSFVIPELFGDQIQQFLQGFVPALAHKLIIPNSPVFCDRAGAKAWFRSSGQMVFSKCALGRLPEENWPVATRTFVVTPELRASAKAAIFLLRTPDTETYEQ